MISIENLSLYIADKPILQNVSLAVTRGETLAIIGESGGGKTSLARLLLGLINGHYWQDEPKHPKAPKGFHWSGKALLDNLDIARATKAELKAVRGKKIGLIVQALADALNPHLTILQHIEEVLAIHNLTHLNAEDACLEFNIPQNLHHRHASSLSGGEIQRVLTALALINKPDALILDEPTASLDPANKQRAIHSFLKDHQNRSQILITHDLDLAQKLADRVAVLHRGRIVEIGTAEQIFKAPSHPYTRDMIMPMTQNRLSQTDEAGGRQHMADEKQKRESGLQVKDLSHGFAGQSLLKHQSFFVPKGQCLAIIGPSGCGKTTLARLLTGFEPIQSGQITWIENALSKSSATERSALVSQHPHRAMARHFSVMDILSEPLLLVGNKGEQKLDPNEKKARILELLDQVGLPTRDDFLTRKTTGLSGGEAQRLVIARALATNPDFLVADEPTSALDMYAKAQILSLLQELKEKRGLAVILLTHDHHVVDQLADHCLEFKDGTLQPV